MGNEILLNILSMMNLIRVLTYMLQILIMMAIMI